MSGTTLICFGNERLTLREDGWAMLAPFGDFPGVAVQPSADGTVTRSRAIQRVTPEYATELANELASVRGKVRRWLRGVPIYSGHPDMPGGSERWPDKRTLGTTHELQVRADGLYCRPVFTNDGAELIEQTSGLGMSARWTGEPVAEVDGVPVYRPAVLRSIGLTANPNLPVELLNDSTPMPEITAPPAKPAEFANRWVTLDDGRRVPIGEPALRGARLRSYRRKLASKSKAKKATKKK